MKQACRSGALQLVVMGIVVFPGGMVVLVLGRGVGVVTVVVEVTGAVEVVFWAKVCGVRRKVSRGRITTVDFIVVFFDIWG